MKTRRDFFKLGLAAAAGAAILPGDVSAQTETNSKIAEAARKPVLRRELFKTPVKIEAVELLRNGRHFLTRVRSADGAVGIADAHRDAMQVLYPIFLQRVAPFFVGKDARDLERLIDGVYLDDSNYKWQGLAFWTPVAAVELAVLDLLGKVAGKSVGELFGNVIKREIPVYRASHRRGNSPEDEIEFLQKLVAETGARAIKFRLGGRMFYDETTTRRDIALIEKTRKTFGDRMTIYADANGSYDVSQAIKIARIMEKHNLGFLEEPVPFDHYEETRQVAAAVKIPIAGGECDSSLRMFQWMIENRAVQIAQPDTFYFGGMIRKIRVARMAQAAGIECTPHMSGYGVGFLHVAHFASVVPNAGKFQEYKGVDENFPVSSETSSLKAENGMLKVPTGAGLGITIDPNFVKKAEIVKS
jgi:L-alanine-DL-glutamate epimerase-like enolase superfamily enzyme